MTAKRLLTVLLLLVSLSIYADPPLSPVTTPNWGIKTNALYWATATPNLGVEIGIGKKSTLDISGGYNPFTFKDDKKWKHWLVQPEYRWWFCEKFNGHFVGVHAHYGEYNVGGLTMFSENMENNRYQGRLYGGGLSYGYQWILGDRWNLQAEIGVGYAYLDYDKFECGDCGKKLKEDNRHYFGVTKTAVSLIYIIK
ncbi:MAG: DUF3575 domain-containing protein [Tannerellaceae bacterium]|nr:DUF3575 domain-containing protein [Tannerellaceae bacterium]